MNIVVENKAKVPNKFVRLIKWKLYNLQEKFDRFIYAEVFVNVEAQKRKDFNIKVKLGIPGNDIILTEKGNALSPMIHRMIRRAKRQINKRKELV